MGVNPTLARTLTERARGVGTDRTGGHDRCEDVEREWTAQDL
jgi:hypothetical protein